MERENKYLLLTIIIAIITGVYTFIVSTVIQSFNSYFSIYDTVWLFSLLVLCSVFGYTYRMLIAKNERKNEKEPLILLDLNGFSPQLKLTVGMTKKQAEKHRKFLKESSRGRIIAFNVEDLQKEFVQGISVPLTFRELAKQ